MTYFPDAIRRRADGPIVVVGGRGVVGTHLLSLLARQRPDLTVSPTSRSARPADAEGRSVLRVDLADPEPFDFEARAVVVMVNDAADRVLRACLAGGVPFVDVTRYTPRMIDAIDLATTMAATSPVVLASGWMGGVLPLAMRLVADEVVDPHRLVGSIVYDLADEAGPDSVEFMDRMDASFHVTVDGQARPTRPLSSAGTALIGGRRRRMLHLDTPEQYTVPRTLGTGSVITRIGFSSEAATAALRALGGVGFFRLARSDRFQPMRRALLYSPGQGGTAEVRIDGWGSRGHRALQVTDPRGQSHLTAAGALVALDLALARSASIPGPSVIFPEQAADPIGCLDLLRACGVEVRALTGDDLDGVTASAGVQW